MTFRNLLYRNKMLRPSSHITFIQQGTGRNLTFSFSYLVDVEINQSIETLTDTCTIKLPRTVYRNGKLINLGEDTMAGKPFFKRGDKVIVKLGYGNALKTRFIGYLRDIKSGIPITISCDDSMYLLKAGKIKQSFKEGKLDDIIKAILPSGIDYKAADCTLGQFNINNASPAKVLESLRSDGIFSYFRNITKNGETKPVLYSGLAYWVDDRKEAKFKFGVNIINGDDLSYRKKDDVLLKVKATSIQADNSRKEIEVGDPDGEVRTVFKYKVGADDLRKFAESELERFKYTGLRGTIPTFGEPAVEKGDVADISGSQYYPDGKYLIKAARITSGVQGYRQAITLDQVLTS